MSAEDRTSDEQKVQVRTVMVGIQLDARGKELLDWAVRNVAEPGDRILAVHVCRDSDLKHASTLSLIRVLDDYLAAYEGVCNLKQVALVGRVSRGNSIRKVVVKEAKLCNAMAVVVGVIKHCSLGGSASLAKYCAKKLPSTSAVIAVQNGKVVFERKADVPSRGEQPTPTTAGAVLHPSTAMNAEIVIPSSAERQRKVTGAGNKDRAANCSTRSSPPANAGKEKDKSESKLGWPLLRRSVSGIPEVKRDGKAVRKMSVVQWAMCLPNRSLLFSKLQSDLVMDLTAVLVNSSSCRWFRYDELRRATNNFSPENVIGKGGSSKVYKGRLRGGQKVAIKLSKLSEASSKDFLLEVDIITKLRHKRIVPLIGICVEDNTLTSVYHYFSKGSLEENLHGNKSKLSLSWDHRYKVAVGVAEALTYLHTECSQPVIHRDLKPSNVLLGDDFEPQLSDFGLAIWAPTASLCLTHNDVVGTFGYLAPEYFMYGKVSDKIDVYAFGVVLLELLTGKKSISDESPKGQESLVMWAKPMLAREDFFVHALDPNLGDSYNEVQVRRMILAASLCITRRAHFRPHISQILSLLQGKEGIEAWVSRQDHFSMTSWDCQAEEICPAISMESHLGLALLDVEDDASVSSFEQSYLGNLEEYLQGRWSRSSSFD